MWIRAQDNIESRCSQNIFCVTLFTLCKCIWSCTETGIGDYMLVCGENCFHSFTWIAVELCSYNHHEVWMFLTYATVFVARRVMCPFDLCVHCGCIWSCFVVALDCSYASEGKCRIMQKRCYHIFVPAQKPFCEKHLSVSVML